MDRKEFGQFLKDLRKKRGLTQAEVAHALQLGKSQSTANWESGRVKFPEKHVEKFCELMKTDMAKFVELMTKVYKDDLMAKVQNKNQKKTA